jgi:beta-galactosidase
MVPFVFISCQETTNIQDEKVNGVSVYSHIEDETVISENKEDTHITFYSFPNEENAIKNEYQNSKNYLSLNGIWKFKWVKKPIDNPYEFLTLLTIQKNGVT